MEVEGESKEQKEEREEEETEQEATEGEVRERGVLCSNSEDGEVG